MFHTSIFATLLSYIESIRCRLLLLMIAVSVCLPVCLPRGSTRLRCARTAERIEILFGAEHSYNTLNIVLLRGS